MMLASCARRSKSLKMDISHKAIVYKAVAARIMRYGCASLSLSLTKCIEMEQLGPSNLGIRIFLLVFRPWLPTGTSPATSR